jgi:hypothetical protein
MAEIDNAPEQFEAIPRICRELSLSFADETDRSALKGNPKKKTRKSWSANGLSSLSIPTEAGGISIRIAH